MTAPTDRRPTTPVPDVDLGLTALRDPALASGARCRTSVGDAATPPVAPRPAKVTAARTGVIGAGVVLACAIACSLPLVLAGGLAAGLGAFLVGGEGVALGVVALVAVVVVAAIRVRRRRRRAAAASTTPACGC